MKPWEKYQDTEEEKSGPWDRYKTETQEDLSLSEMGRQTKESIKRGLGVRSENLEKPSFMEGVLGGAVEQTQKRETPVMIGGAVGAVIGAPLGPLGMIAGGALGAAGGSAFYDASKSVKAMIQGRPDDIVRATEQLKTMGEEARLDIMFSMGGAVLRPILWARSLLAKASGLTTEASKALQATAKKVGIGVGAVDVGGVLPKAWAKTIGVFPWVGTPLRRGQVAKISDVERAINETLNAFGPNYATAQDLSLDMVKAARGARKEFKKTASGLYLNFHEAVQSASRQDIIPTRETKEYAEELIKETKEGIIKLTVGKKRLPGKQKLSSAVRQETIDYLTKLQRLPEFITPAQYRRLTSQELPDLIGKHLKDGIDIRQITKMKGALESDFANIRIDLLPEGEAEAVKTTLDIANKFYSKGIVQFQTKAAKVFERVDPNIFKAGAEKAGSLNADEIYKVAVNLKSPKQIQDLTKLVGRNNMKRAASLNFETAVERSRDSIELLGKEHSIVDPEKLERALGLTGATKEKLAGIRELYKTAGVDLRDVQDLISVMQRIEGIGNPAEFVRRRAVLAGVTGLGAAAGIGGAAAASGMPGGVITGTGLTLLGRHGSKIFSSPTKLRQLTMVLDEARNTALRQALLGKLTKSLTTEE